jgi:hypothetical protein
MGSGLVAMAISHSILGDELRRSIEWDWDM